jgi:hypothetical protein
MKRILSLVLALVLVLGSVPVAFAADQSAGDMLKAAGFVAGDQDGNLNEDQSLTREQMMVLIAEMNGVKEEAATFSIPADFSDVQEDDWFAPYVWYAFYQGWTAGMGDGSFGAGVAVDSKMAATFMLKALDYDVTDYNASVEQAADMGIEIVASDALTRGEGFDAMWSTVNLPKQGSDVDLGVELGKIEAEVEEVVEVTAALDSAEAMSNTHVEVVFEEAIEAASAADFTIVEKADSAEAVEVLDVVYVDGDTVLLETASMDEGTAYSVVVGETSVSFTGIAKESDSPDVDSITGKDEGLVEVVFDMNVDSETATDVANYSINKEGTVVGAEMDGNDTVLLTIEGFETKTSKKMTVENIVSLDGVKMSKTVKTFSPDFDADAPEIDAVTASPFNNVEVIIDFDDDHGVDKATAEDVANYAIDGLEVLAAVATYQDEDAQDDYYDRVVLTTEEQSKSVKYDLEVLYMMDGSTAMNATDEVLEDDFRAGSADDMEPSVKGTPEFNNMTEIEIVFDEDNALDPVTALDLSNYSFEDDELDVVDIAFDDEDDNAVAYDDDGGDQQDFDGHDSEITLILTVKGAEEDERYKLEIEGVTDIYGNEMDDDSFRVEIDAEVKTSTPIDTVNTVDLETVEVVFEKAADYGALVEDTAEDATNYEIEGLGAAIEAEMDGQTVTLTVPEMTVGKTYTLTVNNVENKWGYAAEDLSKTFIATADENDETQPEVEDVDFSIQGSLEVVFSEVMDNTNVTAKTVTVRNTEDSTTYTASAYDVDEDTIYFNVMAENDAHPEVEYEIVSFNAEVVDMAGNTVDYTDKDEEFDTDTKFDADEDALEVSNIFQENGREFYVYFDDTVEVANAVITSLAFDSSKDDGDAADYASATAFDAEVDSDDDTLVILTLQSGTFDDDEEIYLFDFSTDIDDELGRNVMVERIDVDAEYDDEDAPEIDEVAVIDNKTIKVYFNEPLRSDGSWSLIDDDDDDVDFTIDDFDYGEDIIKIVVNGTLDSDVDYTLTVDNAPKDLAGNDYEEEGDEWVFAGVDTDPVDDDTYFFIKNATQAEVSMDGGFGYTQAEGDALIGTDADDFVLTVVGNDDLTYNEDYFVTYDADSEKFLVSFINSGSADEVTMFFDVDTSFKASVDGYTTQAANGLLEFDDVVAGDVTTADNGANIDIIVPFDGYDDDEYDNETFEVYIVVDADSDDDIDGYTLVSSTPVQDDNDVTFTIADGDYAAEDYVFVVKDENGLVVVATAGLEQAKFAENE